MVKKKITFHELIFVTDVECITFISIQDTETDHAIIKRTYTLYFVFREVYLAGSCQIAFLD